MGTKGWQVGGDSHPCLFAGAAASATRKSRKVTFDEKSGHLGFLWSECVHIGEQYVGDKVIGEKTK